MRNLKTRLDRIEARRNPGRLLVCGCALANLRENMPLGEHLPDCPVLTAGATDRVIVVRYTDGGAAGVNNWRR